MNENTFMGFQKRAQEGGLSSAVSQPCSGSRSSDFSGLEGNFTLVWRALQEISLWFGRVEAASHLAPFPHEHHPSPDFLSSSSFPSGRITAKNSPVQRVGSDQDPGGVAVCS